MSTLNRMPISKQPWNASTRIATFPVITSWSLKGQPKRPCLSKKEPLPMQLATPSAASPAPVPLNVPKLDLSKLCIPSFDASALPSAHVTSPSSSSSSSCSSSSFVSSSSPSVVIKYSFYLYPQVDAKEERKVLSLLQSLPSKASAASLRLYQEMVTARQSYESISFRACRLLAAASEGWGERLGAAQDREVVLSQQIVAAEDKSRELEAQIELISHALQLAGL